jgi:hypothetical protein
MDLLGCAADATSAPPTAKRQPAALAANDVVDGFRPDALFRIGRRLRARPRRSTDTRTAEPFNGRLQYRCAERNIVPVHRGRSSDRGLATGL